MDRMTKKQRSYTMSRIKSKWTKQEIKVHNWLKGHKIKHKMHPKIEGSPDIILKEAKIAVFIHGCFWHKCSECFKKPKSNIDYWGPKIDNNAKRDKKNENALRKNGWKVAKIWEHELSKGFETLKKVILYEKRS